MNLYVIVRRNGFTTAEDLEEAAARSTHEGDKDGSGVRWIRSYVLAEESGELGTFCIYEAIARRRSARTPPPPRWPRPRSCPWQTPPSFAPTPSPPGPDRRALPLSLTGRPAPG